MKQVKIGFIGVGDFIVKNHLLTARDSRIMKIRALADLDEERLEQYSSKMDVDYTTTDYKQILDDPEIDMVIIGTKQHLHAKMIIESLEAGKWVFCEKPMSETEQDNNAILTAEERNPGRLAIGFNRRFAPAYVKAKSLMQMVKRPWFIYYRLMWPCPEQYAGYYANQPHILYEGTHILDLACWLLDSAPKRVFMSGDMLRNNCCILDYEDGSRVSLICGSMNSPALWKEYMEIFGYYNAITISDFIDMRVRGFQGISDQIFAPQLNEHIDEVKKYGFDFYEAYRVKEELERRHDTLPSDVIVEPVKRPVPYNFDLSKFFHENVDLWAFFPDKGWVQSLEHFADCFLRDAKPCNADGKAGALSTKIALRLIESCNSGKPVNL